MQKICIFYSEFLKEYYHHASKLEKQDVKQAYLESATMRYMQTSTTTFLDATTKTNIGDEMGRRQSKQMMMNNLKQLGGLGTIYERMQNNLRNIEHCLSFYVDRAGTVDDEGAEYNRQSTKIKGNRGFKEKKTESSLTLSESDLDNFLLQD